MIHRGVVYTRNDKFSIAKGSFSKVMTGNAKHRQTAPSKKSSQVELNHRGYDVSHGHIQRREVMNAAVAGIQPNMTHTVAVFLMEM